MADHDPWATFRDAPEHAGVFIDFDGTIAPIVEDPAEARPLPELVEALVELSARFAVVGVLTGRPVAFLESILPSDILLVGQYGLEISDRGERRDHPQGGAWREVIDHVSATATDRGPDGMRVEPKGLSLTLHYREHPEAAAAVQRFADEQAARSGLVCRPAKMSVELHPPIEADKGTALRDIAEGLGAVAFVGDDVGDLPAFDALEVLAAEGVTTVRVAVGSEEAPTELMGRADVVVDGPAGVLTLLRQLLDS